MVTNSENGVVGVKYGPVIQGHAHSRIFLTPLLLVDFINLY